MMATSHSRLPEEVSSYLADHQSRSVERLLDLTRIASVSADPESGPAMERCSRKLAEQMQALGLSDVRIVSTSGHPVVEGRTPPRPGLPTYMAYAHYDVQPPDPLEGWETPPFEPTRVGDELRGRGISDDKAHVEMHLAAVEAYLATLGATPVNIRFVFEGEEEISSRHFPEWLDQTDWLDELAGCIVSDGTFLGRRQPSLSTGVRGLLYVELNIRTADVDLHSGGYGGAVPNAAQALTTILSALKGEDGRIRIPGFYDDVVDEPIFRSTLASAPWSETEWLDGAHLAAATPVGEEGYSVLERLWLRPSLDINGLWSGYTGDGPKTVIPATAGAKLSCRLVADQDPDRIFDGVERFVLKQAPPWAQVRITKISGSRPARIDPETSLARAARRALASTFGVEPALSREGGSVPVVGMLSSRLKAPLILLSFSPPDDNAHAPNERMPLWNLAGGIGTVANLWWLLGETGREAE